MLDEQSGFGFGGPITRFADDWGIAGRPERTDRPGEHVFMTVALAGVVDARLDNRQEIASRLDLRPDMVSDGELLFRLYDRYRERFTDFVAGDFAAAFIHRDAPKVVLVRDPTGQKPLHYGTGPWGVAFASMPHGLRPVISREVQGHSLALLVADVPRSDDSSYFVGIRRVMPGQILELRPDSAHARSYWRAPSKTLRLSTDSDYIHAYRDVLNEAVRTRLHDAGPLVGAHISGGLDSNAVAATAARLQAPRNGSVLAITAAPRASFAGAVPRDRIGDESKAAAQTAALHPNIEHLVLRTSDKSPLEEMRKHVSWTGEPLGHACNYVWWSRANEAFSARDVRVVLTGESGNLTLSAGGPPILADFVRTGAWLRWAREARLFVKRGFSLRGVGALSIGPWIPRGVWDLLVRRQFGHTGRSEGFALLAPRLRARFEADLQGAIRDARYGGNDRVYRHAFLQSMDPGLFRKAALARWGVDERDVTVDRRLAEFSLALPLDQLLRDGVDRRLARVALADRLPDEVLRGVRGYQFADWYETLSRDTLLREVEELAQNLAVRDLLDMDRVYALAADWPDDGWETTGVIVTYRLTLLRVLGAAHFAAAFGAEDDGAGLAASPCQD